MAGGNGLAEQVALSLAETQGGDGIELLWRFQPSTVVCMPSSPLSAATALRIALQSRRVPRSRTNDWSILMRSNGNRSR